MSNTKDGGQAAKETNLKLYGPDFYKRIGAKGGAASHPNKGFGKSAEWAAEAGRRGVIAKRKKKYEKAV